MGYVTDWEPVPQTGFECRECGSPCIEFREWESSDGAHEDIHYRCQKCARDWWVEGADA